MLVSIPVSIGKCPVSVGKCSGLVRRQYANVVKLVHYTVSFSVYVFLLRYSQGYTQRQIYAYFLVHYTTEIPVHFRCPFLSARRRRRETAALPPGGVVPVFSGHALGLAGRQAARCIGIRTPERRSDFGKLRTVSGSPHRKTRD